MRPYIHTYIHTYVRTYLHTCIHIYIHTCISTCIHVHTCPPPPPPSPAHCDTHGQKDGADAVMEHRSARDTETCKLKYTQGCESSGLEGHSTSPQWCLRVKLHTHIYTHTHMHMHTHKCIETVTHAREKIA